MATMFDFDSDDDCQAMKLFENMLPREFLERLLVDDVVNQIVSSGTILIIEWTSAVKDPCKMICFGIERDQKSDRNLYFVGLNDDVKIKLDLFQIVCNNGKSNLLVDELLEWLRPLNVQAVDYWAQYILEAREQFRENPKIYCLPMRFYKLPKTSLYY